MSLFQKMLDWWFGTERVTMPRPSEATKRITILENGKTLTAAELYEDVVVRSEKEMLAEREAFLIRVGDKTAS